MKDQRLFIWLSSIAHNNGKATTKEPVRNQFTNNKMKEIIRLLFEKWTCKHEWKKHRHVRIFEYPDDKMPSEIRETYICQNCGKIKRIIL